MSFILFIKAFLIGVGIAASPGPISALCVKKSFEIGIKGAFLVGLGASLADSVYAFMASFGLSEVLKCLQDQEGFIKIIGGIFLLYLAYREIKNTASEIKVPVSVGNDLRIVRNVFMLTIINPMTIFMFLGIFSSVNIGHLDMYGALIMVIGIFMGAMIWHTTMGGIFAFVKHKISSRSTKRIMYVSSFMLAALGFFAIFQGIQKL